MPALPTVLPPVERLVAIGDLHGDYAKTLRAFTLAGLIDDKTKWIGGKTVVVQVRSCCCVNLDFIYGG